MLIGWIRELFDDQTGESLPVIGVWENQSIGKEAIEDASDRPLGDSHLGHDVARCTFDLFDIAKERYLFKAFGTAGHDTLINGIG